MSESEQKYYSVAVQIAMELLGDVVNKKIKELIALGQLDESAQTRLRDIAKLLVWIKTDVRVYAVSHPEQVRELWLAIREHDNQMDFIISSVTELHSRLGKIGYTALVSELAYGMGSCGIPYGLSTKEERAFSIDADTLSRLPNTPNLTEIYKNNSWFVLVTLISFMDGSEFFSNFNKEKSKQKTPVNVSSSS